MMDNLDFRDSPPLQRRSLDADLVTLDAEPPIQLRASLWSRIAPYAV
jgi:hypothetical protein